ncbi:hypothetical protein JS565_12575 [Salmonella enterica subsp. enterica serovar Senftenberg]|nr:hypothetical protein [Salmonella enterica subsp. enterica serovar Senftenberg]
MLGGKPSEMAWFCRGTDGIHRHAGVGKTTNIVKPQRGRAIADSSRCVGSGGEIGSAFTSSLIFSSCPC